MRKENCRSYPIGPRRRVTTATLAFPPKLVPVFSQPRGTYQYIGLYGGRGSGKSFSAALAAAALRGYVEPLRILCVREYQASIAESFHAELKGAISNHPWLAEHYDVGRDYLRGRNGTEFIFRGLKNSVKSLAQIDLTIVEEAEDVSEPQWLDLEATVFRRDKSELWALWNPKKQGSPVDARFRQTPRPRSALVELNYTDNPWFPSGLDELRANEERRLDPQTYAHTWQGQYLVNSDAQVFANKYRVEEFTPGKDWDGPYQGGDFGFSQDPTVAVRCWINGDYLYVEYEAGSVKLELDGYYRYITDRIPDFEKYVTRWDSSQPGNISFLKRHGLPRSEGVPKWKGSVEDGISFMRSFKEIVVHPRCARTVKEMGLYSFKVDRKSGDILPDLVDANNHAIDSVRYAINPLIKRRGYDLGSAL